MIDTYSGIKYDEFVVVSDLYGNWYNKLQMYEIYKDGQNLYFDLDIVIFDKLLDLRRHHFTLLDDSWWREHFYALNSSVVSWTGDVSHIWKKFKENDEYYLKRYNKGSDEFYYREIKYQTFSIFVHQLKTIFIINLLNVGMVTLGQMQHIWKKVGLVGGLITFLNNS